MAFEYLKKVFKKKFLNDLAWVYLGSLANGVSLFLINVVLGRFLDKEWFAVFSLSVLALSTVAEMSDFGLNGGLLRFAPYYLSHGEDKKLKQLVKIIWGWRVWLSIILTVGGVALSYPIARYVFNQPVLSGYLTFSFLGVGGVVLLGFISSYLQASRRFLYNSVLQGLKGVLRLLIIVAMIFFGVTGIYYYLAVYLLIPWALFLFSVGALPKGFNKVALPIEEKKQLNSQLANFSFWLAIWSWSAIIASRIDQVMLSNLLGLEQVAIYAVAFQFVYFYSLGNQSISAVLTPRISSIVSKQDVLAFIKRALKWMMPIIVLVAILIYPSQYIITLFFGHKYDASLGVYLILSYSMLVMLMAIPFSLAINVFNKTKLLAISGFLQFAVNVLFNILLIPIFGVSGAAITFAIGNIVSLAYTVICLKYLYNNFEIKVV